MVGMPRTEVGNTFSRFKTKMIGLCSSVLHTSILEMGTIHSSGKPYSFMESPPER
jgi:hypothetical protein